MSRTESGTTPAAEAEDELSHDKILRTLARHFLPDLVEILYPELAPVVDFSAVEFLNGKLFADFRKKGHLEPDVVVKLRTLGGEPQFGLFHAELEYEHRNIMEKRLKMYSHQLALEYEDPPIVSAAVFLRGGPSGVEKREVVSQLGPVVTNRFYYVAFGLSGSLAEEFVERPQPLAGALAALMGSKIWDRVDKKMACFEAVQRADVDDEKRYLLKSVVENYVELDEEEQKRFAAKLQRDEHKEVRKMVQTLQEAQESWEARGKAEGRVEAAREAIAHLAKHHHGSVPPEFAEKLETIDDTERLHHILEQVTEVPSLDQIDFGS